MNFKFSNLVSKIQSEESWRWANTDRFGGKLKHCIDRCNEALEQDPQIKMAIMDGEPMSEEQVTRVARILKHEPCALRNFDISWKT